MKNAIPWYITRVWSVILRFRIVLSYGLVRAEDVEKHFVVLRMFDEERTRCQIRDVIILNVLRLTKHGEKNYIEKPDLMRSAAEQRNCTLLPRSIGDGS